MSVETTRETMNAYLLAVLDQGAYARYLAPDVVLTIAGTGQRAKGREPVARLIALVGKEALDGAHELRQLVCEEGRSAVEAEYAHGQECVPYAAMYRLADDQIREIRLYGPVTGLMTRPTDGDESNRQVDMRRRSDADVE